MAAAGQFDPNSCPTCRELMLRVANALRQLAQINAAISRALIDWELGNSKAPDSNLVNEARLLREQAANVGTELQNHRGLHHGMGVASRSKTAMP